MSEAPNKILVDADEAQYLCADEFPDHPEDVPGVEYTRSDLIPQWQDIETAPKDGTPVLLYANCKGWEECGMSRVVGWFDKRAWSSYGPAFGEPVANPKPRQQSPQRIGTCNPTHWMPLPQPPQQNS